MKKLKDKLKSWIEKVLTYLAISAIGLVALAFVILIVMSELGFRWTL